MSSPYISLICALAYFVHTDAAVASECATVNSNSSTALRGFTFRDMTVIGDRANEQMIFIEDWVGNGTWGISPGCKVQLCGGKYLTGKCRFMDEGTSLFSHSWQSAKCQCIKGCSCENVHLRRSLCAHVYHTTSGCNDCHAPYTELETGNVSCFTNIWRGKVDSILVRPGCKLTIYEEDDFSGESFTMDGSRILQELKNPPGSYQCECPNYLTVQDNQRSNNSPALMDIPQSLDEIIASQNRYPNHPGFKAALSSFIINRSSKNAYILVLGSSGAGKSSTINALLGQRNVTAVGSEVSTTSEIIELRIPISLPELGINNSQLRLIDTPGMGDTSGIEKDALFLATLDDYLSSHDELKTRIPNLVLVFHRFDDNRRDGVGSNFVRLIRVLNDLRDKIADKKFSNLIFVFSHLCSVLPKDQKNPSRLLREFEKTIKKYSLFSDPIRTVVVENKGKYIGLPMVMGNYLLPSQEYYPKNLVQKIQVATTTLNDKIGNAIVKAALGTPNDLSDIMVEALNHKMVPSNHNKVAHYLNILSANAFAENSTEISELLQQGFNRLLPLSERDPAILENLQKYLYLRNIRTTKDLPQTSLAKVELLKDLPIENGIYNGLLKDALDVVIPTFPEKLMIGYGYNNLTGCVVPRAVVNLDVLKPSNTGFMIPNVIESRIQDEMGFLLDKIRICKDTLSSCSSIFYLSFNTYTFKLKADSEASLAYAGNTDHLKPFDKHNFYNVASWKNFFDQFGTHVVVSANVGGKIEVHFKVNNQSVSDDDIEKFQNDFSKLIMKEGLAPNPLHSDQRPDISYNFVFRGGNPVHHVLNIDNLGLEEIWALIKNWKISLKFYPIVFMDQIQPIPEYFRNRWSKTTFNKVSEALSQYLNSTLTYVPAPPPTVDPRIVEELEAKRKQQEEHIKRAEEAATKAKAEERERRRLAEEEQAKRQEEAKRRADARTRQLERAEAERQRGQRERQKARRQHEHNTKVQEGVGIIKSLVKVCETSVKYNRNTVMACVYSKAMKYFSSLQSEMSEDDFDIVMVAVIDKIYSEGK